MAETTITRNYQITLTKDIRDKLGLKEGDILIMNSEGERIIIEKRKVDIWGKIGKCLPDDFEEILKSTRTDYTERLKRLGVVR